MMRTCGPRQYSHPSVRGGSLYTEWSFTTPSDAVTRFLSFGDRVKVLDPTEIVE